MRIQNIYPRGSILVGVCILFFTMAVHSASSGLINAARQGDLKTVRSLLLQNAHVNEAGGDGMTALHWAVYEDNAEIARLLIGSGADVNSFNRTRAVSPLILAADNGDSALIDLLLKAGADVNLANAQGTTPLMRAAAAGSVEAVKALLKRGASINAKETTREQTALMFAAALDRPEVIRTLASFGADLNATSKVVANATDLMDEDGNPIPTASRTGATQATAKGDGQSRGLGGRTALIYAAREGQVESVRALVEAGADVNKVDPLDGSSALIVAISNGHYDSAKHLLDHGANPNLATSDGLGALYATLESQWAPVSWTPTAFTAANGIVQQTVTHFELMKALLRHGANPNARITKSVWFSPPHHNVSWVKTAGSTPFWRAAEANDIPAMKLLVAAGGDPRIVTDDNTTALAVAAGVGWAGNFSTNAPDAFIPAVKYLAEEIGIDANIANTSGYTALMGAAWRGDNDLIQYLAGRGAKLDLRNQRGWSATDMANGPFIRGSEVPVKHPETIALLLKLGAPGLTATDDDEVLGGGKRKAATSDLPDSAPADPVVARGGKDARERKQR